MTMQKRLLVLVVGAMAGMVVAASAAFACANLTTINLSEDSAAAGSTVGFRGDAFRDSSEEKPASDVVVHWNSRSGEVLWSGPSANRTVEGTFTVPNVEPGNYMVVATQFYEDTGDPVPGAPARASIEVTSAQASGAAVSRTQAGEGKTSAASGEQAAAAEQGGAVSQPSDSEQPGAQASSLPQESAAGTSAAGTQSGAATSQSAASASSVNTTAVGSSPAEPNAAATSPSSTAAVTPPAVEQAARFAAAERLAAVSQAAAAPVSQVAGAAAFAAAERAAAASQDVTAASPQSAWSSAASTTTAAWTLLALALAMGAALLATRTRRRAFGLAVGRLPMP